MTDNQYQTGFGPWSDVSVVVTGLPYDDGVDWCGVLRMRARGPSPGVVKAASATAENKVTVLRCKQMLKSDNWFQKVFSSSVKLHTVWILELNFKTLLWEIPARKDFYIFGSGRLMKRTDLEATAAGSPAAGGRGWGGSAQPVSTADPFSLSLVHWNINGWTCLNRKEDCKNCIIADSKSWCYFYLIDWLIFYSWFGYNRKWHLRAGNPQEELMDKAMDGIIGVHLEHRELQ